MYNILLYLKKIFDINLINPKITIFDEFGHYSIINLPNSSY